MAETNKRVAVIGAGVAGLAAIKCCLDEGLQPTCFERFDDIGGLWTYRDIKDSRLAASVFKCTVMNTSKEATAYSDFPIPKEWPNYLHNSYLKKYIEMFADRFGLKEHIRFSTSVTRLDQARDYDTTGRWVVTTKHKNEEETSQEFDAVMICTGMFHSPHRPDFPGLSEFKGKILHTNDYRTPKEFEDKRVVVIGIGNSACDAATDTGRVASKVFLSARRGAWIVSRRGHYGYPIDLMVFRKRFLLPIQIVIKLLEKSLRERYYMISKPLLPSFELMQCEFIINEDIPGCILNGSVIVKGNVSRFTKTGVEFEDGSYEDDIDAVIFATGYRFKFPFEVTCPELQTKNDHVPLYKQVFPLGLKHSTLSVNGAILPLGVFIPCVELQARWAARVFKGLAKLPSQPEMETEVKMTDEEMKKMYIHNHRYSDDLVYMDSIASEIGVLPNFLKLFFTHPVLALRVFYGPALPYRFRLTGPGKWDGAREAITTVWDRVLEPTKTRIVATDHDNSGYLKMFLLGGIALVVIAVAMVMM